MNTLLKWRCYATDPTPYDQSQLRALRYTRHKDGWLSPVYELALTGVSVLDLRPDGRILVRQATPEFAARCRAGAST